MADSTSIQPERGIDQYPRPYRHIMLDAARRRRLHAFLIVVLFVVPMSILVSSAPWRLTESGFIFNALILSWVLPWIALTFSIDNRAVLWLPVSEFARGRYNWTAGTLAPLGLFAPLIMGALYTFESAAFAASMILTSVALFPLTVFFHFGPLKKIAARVGGYHSASLGAGLIAQFINRFLFQRFGFPWFFVALAPFALVAMHFSYRNANQLGAAHFVVKRNTGQGFKQIIAEPWGTLCRNLLAAAAVGSGFLLIAAISDQKGTLLPQTALIPLMSFVVAGGLISRKIGMLRSLPISRTAVAAVALGLGVVGTFLPVLAYELLRDVLQLNILPVPVHLLLIYMSICVFLPGLFLIGQWGKQMAFLLGFAYFLSLFIMSWAQSLNFWTPLHMRLTFAVFPACLAAAFFFIRHALLRSRLDVTPNQNPTRSGL